MMERCLTALFASLVIFWGGASYAGAGLPEIAGYSAGPTKAVPLEAPSGNFGEWLSRTYVNAFGGRIEATLMSGPGAGPLVSAPVGTRTDDRPIGFGATYEVFELDGMRSVFESSPDLGSSLAVAVDSDVVLTLESRSLGREELERAAMAMLRSE
ncbi:MAG: hypothetical protein GX181_01935 [Synergistaceae bacterium]|nr:hypothetical protein [Synergistota bacterium]NLM70706.1 hypothetical protein [Synergistaceae bacterium]